MTHRAVRSIGVMSAEDAEPETASASNAEPLSLEEFEKAYADQSHPRHAEAKRLMDTEVKPALRRVSASLMPKLSSGGFASLKMPSIGRSPVHFEPPRSPFHDSLAQSQENFDAMMDDYQRALAEKEDIAAEEKADSLQRQEDDRKEARRQHNVMLGWTIASVGLALIATVVAVIALFVSNS